MVATDVTRDNVLVSAAHDYRYLIALCAGRIRVAVALGLMLGLGSCLPTEPTGSLPRAGETTLLVRADLSGTAAATVVVEVTAPDFATAMVFNIPIVNRVATGTITLQAGSSRTITMRAFDAGGVQTHRGSVTVNIQPGTNPTISIVLMPLTSDVSINATLGSFTVTVAPAANTLTVGDTGALTAAILDANGNSVSGQVAWATMAPAVATVVSTGQRTGRLTAVGPGQTTVVATYGGTAGPTTIAVSSDPKLPAVLLDTHYSAPTGATITVPAGADFQAALNAAQPGDQILLAAGATYTGPFTLPVKAGNSWILIRSSTADANLPAEGQRMKPSYAAVLPKIVSPDAGPAIQTAPGAHHYRFLGVEITTTATSLNYGLVLFGDGGGAQNSLAQVPHDLILDRTYIHGNATVNLSRCVALNSAASAVIDSYLSECHAKGQDAQAIAGWNGPGPFKIVNNYLEGSGENVMFGGSDPSIPNLIPSDIEIRRNYFFKPLAWYPAVWSIKNLLELKLGRRILIQGNIFENSWAESQTGFAMLIWSVNQSGTTSWAQTADVWIRENIIRHAASGVMITDFNTDHPEYPTLYTQRVRFDNNLWEDISTSWGGDGRLIQVASGSGQLTAIKFYHQTGFAERTLITIASGVTQQFEFANIIVDHGLYGIHADDASEQGALDLHMPGYLFAGNAVIGGAAASYPTGNFFPATMNNVGFVNAAGGDYRLAASSPYKNRGTDGTDPGADITAILNWTNGVDQ